jgi:hypothetical protein
MAKKLYGILAKRRMIQRTPSMQNWAYYFRLLHTKDKVSNEDINNVLDQYEKIIGSKYSPKIYSAKMFRERFDHLANRLVELCKSESNPRCALIVKRLLQKPWPARATSELEQAVSQSFNFVENLFKNIRKFLKEKIKGNTKEIRRKIYLQRFAKYLDDTWSDPKTLVETWFTKVNLKIRGWKNWNGSLERFIISNDDLDFFTYAQNLAKIWGNDQTLWDDLLKEFYAN